MNKKIKLVRLFGILFILCSIFFCHNLITSREDTMSQSIDATLSKFQIPSFDLTTPKNLDSISYSDIAIYVAVGALTAVTLYGIHRWIYPTKVEPERRSIETQTDNTLDMTTENIQLQEQLSTAQAHSLELQAIKNQENNIISELNNLTTNPFQENFKALYNEEIPAYNITLNTLTTSFERNIQEEEKDAEEQQTLKKNKTVANRMISPKHSQNLDSFQAPHHIILKVVHGTFATAQSSGADLNKPFSQALDVFAKQLALAANATVKFDAFQWNSQLSLEERMQAGHDLAEEIKNDKTELPGAIIWMIGHSHGCNVINFAAQNLKNHSITIDNGIFLASPVLDINPLSCNDKSYNIQSLLNIWGSNDVTGAVGSIFSTTSTGVTSSLRKDQALNNNEIVRNIILKCDGRNLNHASIKVNSMHFLAGIIQYIGNDFLIPTNMILNVYDKSAIIQQHAQASSSQLTQSQIEEEEQDYIPIATHAQWEIQGVIDNKDPLRSEQLQKMLSPGIKSLLEKSIELSHENEQDFERTYNDSIHKKPALYERFMSEYGKSIIDKLYQWFGW